MTRPEILFVSPTIVCYTVLDTILPYITGNYPYRTFHPNVNVHLFFRTIIPCTTQSLTIHHSTVALTVHHAYLSFQLTVPISPYTAELLIIRHSFRYLFPYATQLMILQHSFRLTQYGIDLVSELKRQILSYKYIFIYL